MPPYCRPAPMSAALGVPTKSLINKYLAEFLDLAHASNPSRYSTLELAKTDSGMRPFFLSTLRQSHLVTGPR
jgi:hypothetical protein